MKKAALDNKIDKYESVTKTIENIKTLPSNPKSVNFALVLTVAKLDETYKDLGLYLTESEKTISSSFLGTDKDPRYLQMLSMQSEAQSNLATVTSQLHASKALDESKTFLTDFEFELRIANIPVRDIVYNDPIGSVIALQLERIQTYDNDIRTQQQDMQARNNLLKQMNEVMSTIRAGRPTKTDDEKVIPQSVVATALALGIKMPDCATNGNACSQGDWDNTINNIKTAVDQNSSDSQFDTIRLKSMIDKRNQAFELISNLYSKQQQVMDALIRKFGS